MSGTSKFLPAGQEEPPVQEAPAASAPATPANDAPAEPAATQSEPVQSEPVQAASPTQESKFMTPGAEPPPAAQTPSQAEPAQPAAPQAATNSQQPKLYTLDSETTPVQAEVQLLSGTHLSLSQLLDSAHDVAYDMYGPKPGDQDRTAGFYASLDEDARAPKQSRMDSAMDGLAGKLAKSGIFGPEDSLCITPERHENGDPKTRICVSANPTKRAGMMMTGSF